jgi:hypothetical protein
MDLHSGLPGSSENGLQISIGNRRLSEVGIGDPRRTHTGGALLNEPHWAALCCCAFAVTQRIVGGGGRRLHFWNDFDKSDSLRVLEQSRAS